MQGPGVRRMLAFIEGERIRRGWTASELAERSGLDPATVSRMFAGHTVPTLESLECLAQAVDVRLESLLMLGYEVNEGDRDLLWDRWRRLSEPHRKVVLELIDALVEVQDNQLAHARSR